MAIYRHSRELAAPPAAVFAAIADPRRLARWWGPEGFTNRFEQFEFWPGGSWRLTMHGPDGRSYPNAAEFAEIVPDARVRIRHVSKPVYELTVELRESPGGTTVLWTQQFEDPKVGEALRRIVEPGNEQNLARLEREVTSVAPGDA